MKILHAGSNLELFPATNSRFDIRANNSWVGLVYFTKLSGGGGWVLELYPEIAATRGFIERMWISLSQHLGIDCISVDI